MNRLSRREMLKKASSGFGSVALMGLMGSVPFGCTIREKSAPLGVNNPLSPSFIPHIPPKAKHIIFLYMDGGVSQVDSFDPKPRLAKDNGLSPYDIFEVEATQFNNIGKILKSPWEFTQYGESGIPVSDLFPHIGSCVDDLAVVRSMVSDFPEHTNANYFLHTGIGIQGRPSMGAWVNYGLGSENEDLPGYIVIDGGLVPPGGNDNFTNGFLPASFQASYFKAEEIPLANVVRHESEASLQTAKLNFAKKMDKQFLEQTPGADAIESAISNYELAFRMQAAVPDLMNLKGESKFTKQLYGLYSHDPNCRSYGMQCLLARRLVERGVRFIELTCPRVKADRWDQHNGLREGHFLNAHAVDQPIAGLLKDLKGRGLLDETLVVFAGEFGRTPFAQGRDGRDHNPSAFSIWMAGAGIKGGTIYGKTDAYGYRVVENPTTIHDLHATMLHLLGINHTDLTYRFSGRDIRLTDVAGNVIHDILG